MFRSGVFRAELFEHGWLNRAVGRQLAGGLCEFLTGEEFADAGCFILPRPDGGLERGGVRGREQD
jgi:hypothetical protein